MSNPPFGSPIYGEEENFSFPFHQVPNDPNPLRIEDISPDSFPDTSISISDYQDLSMFLDDHEEEFPLTGQFPSTQTIPDEWAREIGNQVQPGAEGSSGNGIHHLLISNGDDHDTDGGGVGSMKKLKVDHNARERNRRMKIKNSYLALRSLLPDSKRAQRCSAPYIIDRALEYIPKLEAEIDKLTVEKRKMVSVIGNNKQQMQESITFTTGDHDKHTLTVSINEVKRGELIIQICEDMAKLDHKFSNLIKELEGEDIHVMGASSQCVSQHRSCFHLHIQMGENPIEADYIEHLQKKLTCWMS